MEKSGVYQELVLEIKKLPSVSKKMAEKIALWFLGMGKGDVKVFLDSIVQAIYKINKCSECNAIVEGSLVCDICLDSSRDDSKLCIVQDYNNLSKMESINVFDGKYFIFDAEISHNSKNINAEDQKKINQLVNKINEFEISEIIILLDFTISGEFTAFYLRNHLKKHFSKIKIYRPAIGMPINSSIDYIDNESLEWSIRNKNEI